MLAAAPPPDALCSNHSTATPHLFPAIVALLPPILVAGRFVRSTASPSFSPIPNGSLHARIPGGRLPPNRLRMPTARVAHTAAPSDSPPALPSPTPSGYSPQSNCGTHATVAQAWSGYIPPWRPAGVHT